MCSRFVIFVVMAVILHAAPWAQGTPCWDSKSWAGLTRPCPTPYFEDPILGCIYFESQLMSHDDAINHCMALNPAGNLLDVHLTPDLNAASHIVGDSVGIWTGPKYFNNGSVVPNEAAIVDSFVVNWGVGFPDNSTLETCISGYRFAGFAMQQWNYNCNIRYPFFCKINDAELIGSK